jgi:hypothetical protein
MLARREVPFTPSFEGQNLRGTFLAARGNSSNSLQITSLADPHTLTPVESHPYKNNRVATPLCVLCALRLCDLCVKEALCLQQRCKFAPLFSINCRMLRAQPLSFQAFALLPGGGYTPPSVPFKFYFSSAPSIPFTLPARAARGASRGHPCRQFRVMPAGSLHVLPHRQLRTVNCGLPQ